MDLTAEYARRYGGAPRADQNWHEVLALARRVARFEARDVLLAIDAGILSQPGGAMNEMHLAKLRRIGGT